MHIREATEEDFERIWPIFHEVVAEEKTYAYPRDLTKKKGVEIWITSAIKTYVFEETGSVLGTYYIKTNQPGRGSHVCNCGYMVSSQARGRGLGAAMCKHSQAVAKELGYQAMQFNFVISTNESAVRLWRKLGFTTVGRLPRAFDHPSRGYVDALVMYKWLKTSG